MCAAPWEEEREAGAGLAVNLVTGGRESKGQGSSMEQGVRERYGLLWDLLG